MRIAFLIFNLYWSQSLMWPSSVQHNKISTSQCIGLILLRCANFVVLCCFHCVATCFRCVVEISLCCVILGQCNNYCNYKMETSRFYSGFSGNTYNATMDHCMGLFVMAKSLFHYINLPLVKVKVVKNSCHNSELTSSTYKAWLLAY